MVSQLDADVWGDCDDKHCKRTSVSSCYPRYLPINEMTARRALLRDVARACVDARRIRHCRHTDREANARFLSSASHEELLAIEAGTSAIGAKRACARSIRDFAATGRSSKGSKRASGSGAASNGQPAAAAVPEAFKNCIGRRHTQHIIGDDLADFDVELTAHPAGRDGCRWRFAGSRSNSLPACVNAGGSSAGAAAGPGSARRPCGGS